MGNSTAYLNLYKTNMLTDGDDFFDFKRDLDDNWDKVDTCCALMNTAVSTKANSALDNLADSGKAKFDGKWTSHAIQIMTQVNLSSSTYSEYTLDFLPDNGEYELMCNYGMHGGSNNGFSRFILTDEANTVEWNLGLNTNSTYDSWLFGSVMVVIKNKKIKAKKAAGGNGNERFSLTVIAYRKLGVGFDTTNESEVTQNE